MRDLAGIGSSPAGQMSLHVGLRSKDDVKNPYGAQCVLPVNNQKRLACSVQIEIND